MNRELPVVQAGFRKGRGIRDQIANIHWIKKKGRAVVWGGWDAANSANLHPKCK